MAEVKKSVLVSYSASQMFTLVDRIEDYPKFLPWCGGASVTPLNEHLTQATIVIDYYNVRQSFTTENSKRVPELIEMKLLHGPFQNLDGSWRFIALTDDACKIEFRLHYEFSNELLEQILAPVFHLIADSFVNAFVTRAEKVYGAT